MVLAANPTYGIVDPLFNLASAAYSILKELSQKVVELVSSLFMEIAELTRNAQPDPAPVSPEEVDDDATKTPAAFLHPRRNPISGALNECLAGTIEMKGISDPEANLKFLYDLTFRRICTSLPQKNGNR